jgi:glycosyltransferase involved in cell wall biosynthesis
VYPDGDILDLPAHQISARVTQVLERIQPDVVAIYGWSTPDALAATVWCARTATPSVVMSATTARDFQRTWWKEMVKKHVVQAHQAGFVGGEPHARYLSKLGMPEERITVGYDVVDNRHFAVGAAKAQAEEDSVRKRLGLPSTYFLGSCRFIEKKNLPRLLRAYAQYRRQESNAWDLVILGDGPLKSEILALRAELQLEGSVHLPGFKQYDELPAYYGLASAFVHASTTEQWGLVVNEAMAAGLPVLVSERCGCVPDLVKAGQNGFTFNPYDTDEMTHLLMHMTSRDSQRTSMGAESRSIISQWTPETFAKGLLRAATIAREAPSTQVGQFQLGLIRILQRVQSV